MIAPLRVSIGIHLHSEPGACRGGQGDDHLGTGLGQGYLVLFDLRKEISWEEKLTRKEVERQGKHVVVLGC